MFLDAASGANTVTIAAGNTGCANLDCTGFTGTVAGSAAITVTGNVKLVAGMTYSYTGTMTVNATGAQTITSGGKSWGGSLTVDSSGGSYQLQDALTLGATNTLTLTRGTFDMNSKAVSVGFFASSNANARALNNTGAGGSFSLTGSGAYIFNTDTPTNFTLSADVPAFQCTYSGGVGSRGIAAKGTEAQIPSFSITAGTDSVFLESSGAAKNLDFTGFAGTWTPVNTGSIYGNLTLAAGMTIASSAGTITFAATSGTKTITSNGKTLDFPITFNGVGGHWRPVGALTIGSTRTLTLTNGHFDMNGVAVSTGLFSSSNSNTRSITSGGATLALTGNAATIWTTATSTNLTFNDLLTVDATYSGAAGTRTLTGRTIAGGTRPRVKISAGTDTVVLSQRWHDIDFTGFAGTFSNTGGGITLDGSLTLVASMAVSGTNALTFDSTAGTETITSAGKSMDFNGVTFNGVGGTWQLTDAMTVGSTRTTQLVNGTLDLNGKTLTTGLFQSSNSNIRVLTFGASGKIATTDTTAATVFDCATGTNLTVNRTGGSIEIGGNTANTRTAALGAQTWPSLTFTNTTGGGRLDITGDGFTLKSLAVTNAPQSIMRAAGTTGTIEDANGFPSGTLGNLVTIGSITAASHTWAKSGGGRISSNYLSISRSTATPANTWYAGVTSTDGGNNSGWNFTDPPSFPTGMAAAFRP